MSALRNPGTAKAIERSIQKGWLSSSIGKECVIVNGGTPKSSVPSYWDGDIQWITPAEMGRRISPFIAKTRRTLSQSGLQNSSARQLPPYSVILSSRAPIGHLVINTQPMSTNQGCKGLVPCKNLHYKYLFYYLTSIIPLLNDLGTGTTFKELSSGKLKDVSIPLPSIAEQERIITILDKAFEGITTVKANGSKVLASTVELFDSRVAEIFEAKNEGWKQQKLDDVCNDITVGHVGSMSKEYRAGGIPFLRSQNIRPFQISLENVVYIDAKFNASLKKSQLYPGDLAIVRTGYPGTAAVIPPDLQISNCSDLVIVRPGPALDSSYLAHFFNSTHGKRLVLGNLVGSAQKHFNIGAAKGVSVPVPPLSQQRYIVSMLDEFRAETQRLEVVQLQKLKWVEALKQSLLHQAFSGKL